ncbi:MAG: diguanylate cyclase [Acidimicrobiales bacterium]|nr:diguanylate cyclase [Acidimicrobiales bacterium]
MVADSADVTILLDDQFRIVARVVGASGRGFGENQVAEGRHPLSDVHPADLPAALGVIGQVADRDGAADSFHLRLKGPDGGWWNGLCVVTNARDDPAIGGLVLRVHLTDDAVLSPVHRPERTPIADIAPCGIDVRDAHGQVVFANHWLQQRCPTDGEITDWLEFVNDRPDGEALVRAAALGRAAEDDFSFDLEAGTVWFRIRAEPHRAGAGDGDGDGPVIGVVTTIVDATAEVEARQRLERREQLLSATFAAVDQGILVIGAGGVVTDANGAAHAHLGEPQGALIGSPLSDSLLSRVVEANDALLPTREDNAALRVIDSGDSVTGRIVRYAHPDGRDRWLISSICALAATRLESTAAVVTIADITERHEQSLLHEHLAMHDSLTGLPNRAAIVEHLTGAIARRRRPREVSGGVLFCDLDGFKAVNDTHGHAAGDRVLVVVADRIRSACRTGDRVGRFGGDEFLVVLENLDQPTEIARIADRVIQAMTVPILIGDRPFTVGLSVGIAVSDGGDDDATAVIDRADAALYDAKRAGRGVWRARY